MLYSDRNIILAAHCIQAKGDIQKRLPNQIVVRLGAYNITANNEENAVNRSVTDIRIHPEWNVDNDEYDADVAVIVLNQTVTYTDFIKPVSLPADGVIVKSETINIEGTIVGWGFGSSQRHEEISRQATIKATNDSHCYRTQPTIVPLSSSRTFCAGAGNGIPTRGDSGGGFFVNSSSGWVQYGVVSATNVDRTLFAVFANLKLFKTWIMDTVDGKISLNCSYGYVFNS